MRKLPVDFLAPSRPNRSTESSDAKAVRSDSSSLGAKATSPSEESAAPIDLMSEFLLLITGNKMREAMQLSEEILRYEPHNRVVLEYRLYLQQYIDQGLDQEEKSGGDDDDDEEGDDDDDDDEEDGDDDNEEDTSEDEEHTDSEEEDEEEEGKSERK